MDTKTYDTDIQKARNELDSVIQQSNKAKLKYHQILAEYLPNTINTLVRRAIEHNPDSLTTLSGDKRAALKKSIEDQIASTIGQLKNTLDSNISWGLVTTPKEHESKSDFLWRIENAFRQSLESAIRLLLGSIGGLLLDSNIVKIGDEWKKATASSSLIYSTPYALPNESVIRDMAEDYNHILYRYTEAIYALTYANEQKKKAEAIDLWNNT